MKFAIALSVICCFCYMGFTIRSQLNERHNFYLDVLNFINSFLINVKFYKYSTLEFLQKYQSKTELKKIIDYVLLANDENDKKQLLVLKNISEEEKNNVLTLFKQIGNTDSENQESILEKLKVEYQSLVDSSKEELERYGNVAFKITTITGVLIAVLLI